MYTYTPPAGRDLWGGGDRRRTCGYCDQEDMLELRHWLNNTADQKRVLRIVVISSTMAPPAQT